jgi:outer membrane protein assembly factor BamB
LAAPAFQLADSFNAAKPSSKFINALFGCEGMSFGFTKVFAKHGGRIIEKWIFDAKSPLVCPAAVADIGGTHRIAIGTKNGAVVCVDEEGKELWTYGTQEKLGETESWFVDQERVHSIDAVPVIHDVDGDGEAEVIVGTERGLVYCLSMDGNLRWKHDCGGSIKASVLVADINHDGKPEIVVGSSNNKLTVLSGVGKQLFEYKTTSPVESVPMVLHGRRSLIIFGTNEGDLIAITAAQERAWKASLNNRITAAPVHLHSDEEERVVVGTVGGDLFCVSETGEIVWEYKTQGSIYSAVAIADVNGDRQHEILFGSCDNNVYALSMDGKKVWSYATDFWVTTTPLVTDIDEDGRLEVIIGSYDHNVYILDGEGAYVLDYVPGISDIVNQVGHYSNMLTSDPGELQGKKIYQFRTDGIVVGCSLLERKHMRPALIVNIKSGKIGDLQHEK